MCSSARAGARACVKVCVCVYVCVVGLWYLELFEVGGSESRPPMMWHRDVSVEIRTELPLSCVFCLGDFSRKTLGKLQNEYDSGNPFYLNTEKGCKSEDPCRCDNELVHELTENKK